MAVGEKLQHLTYTAVPRGIGRGRMLRVGVRITPRLWYSGTGGTLNDFPDFRRWPIGGFWWSASFDGGQTWEPAVDEIWTSDGGFWEAVFHPDLRVDPQPIRPEGGNPLPQHTIRGYPYRQLADQLPEFHRSHSLQASSLGQTIAQRLFEPSNPLPPENPVERFFRFYRPRPTPDPSEPPPRGQIDPDFHQRVSLISDHGPLLERLGLVLELLFRPRAAGENVTSVAVRLNWETPEGGSDEEDRPAPFRVPTLHASPITAVDPALLGSSRFAVRRSEADGQRFDPLLRLKAAPGDQVFSAHDINVDGSLIAAVGADGPGSAPPAASSSGFHLVLDSTAEQAQGRLERGRAAREKMRSGIYDGKDRLRPQDLPTLDSDHIVHGLDIQVQHLGEPGQPWRGLCHREVVYTARATSGHEFSFTARGVAPVLTSFRKVDPAEQGVVGGDLETSDVLTRWDGWSLAVHRPGVYELQADASTGEVVTEPGQFETGTIDIQPRLPAGEEFLLPPLRFGHQYRFRLRAVDITGFAHDWSGAPESDTVTYRRHDPVPTPLVLPPARLTRTENARRLVVRSPRKLLGSGLDGSTARALVPPLTSVETAITHGVFDKQGAPDPDAWSLISELDARVPATLMSEPRGANAQNKRIPTPVTWLADPMCVRVGVSVAPGQGQPLNVATFLPPGSSELGVERLGAWRSVTLLVKPVTERGRVSLDTIQRDGHQMVVLELGPGLVRKLRVRGLPPDARLDELALVQQFIDVRDELYPAPSDGELIDRVCPPVELTAVHAVPRPLDQPSAESVSVRRTFDDLHARVTARVKRDFEATGRLTVYARWSEPRDLGVGLPALAAPSRIEVDHVECGETTVDLLDHGFTPDPVSEIKGRLVLPDRRRRDVELYVVATGRYLEEFRTVLDAGFTNVAGTGWLLDLPDKVDVESVRLLLDDRDLVRSVDYELVRDPRAKKSRLTLRLLDPSIRKRVEVLGVPQSVTRRAHLAKVVVPAAKRPDPPDVAYVIPAFTTSAGHQPSGQSVAKRGAPRIRIWLERPWWSSGDGEKLAVIWRMDRALPADSAGEFKDWYADADKLGKLVTLLAQDPTHQPRPLKIVGGPAEQWKRMQPQPVTGTPHPVPLTIPEIPDSPPVWVQLHEVKYDKGRDMYYAEVGWDADQYGMFARLAVARFQEAVTEGIPQLSKIRTLDPVELLPARTATARNVGNQIEVTVSGNALALGAGSERLLLVSVEKRVRGGDDHLGWETVQVKWLKSLSQTPVRLSRPANAGKHRILVEEYEAADTWMGAIEDHQPATVHDKIPSLEAAYDEMRGRRPVWVTTLPIPKN